MTRALILIAVVLAVALGSRSFLPADAVVTGSGATLAMGLMLLMALLSAQLSSPMRLPALTAYILIGALMGPDGLGLLTTHMIGDLSPVKSVAVGLIALLAGCELNLRALAPRLRQIGLLSLAGLVSGFVLIAGALFAMSGFVPFGEGLSLEHRLLVSMLCALVLCAFSPPVVIGVLTEARAKGPLTELWIAIAVLADIAVVLTFSLSSAVASQIFTTTGGDAALGGVLWHLLGSFGLGLLVGPVLAFYISRVGRRVGLFTFAVLFVIAQVSGPLHLDPLLVGLTAGLFVENVSPVSGEQVIHQTEVASLPTFALFFTLIGAEITFDDFLAVAPYAVGLSVVRAAAFFVGIRALGDRSGADARTRAYVPFGMLPQAGVAIALGLAIERTFTPWGPPAATLILGTVVVSQIVGPIAFRLAVERSGEANQRHDLPLAEHPAHAQSEPEPAPESTPESDPAPTA